jgi:hypothetical protein
MKLGDKMKLQKEINTAATKTQLSKKVVELERNIAMDEKKFESMRHKVV